MMPPTLHPIYTIGHSTRSMTEFVQLLKIGSVGMIIDIRKTPRSRTHPQFGIDVLPAALAKWQIAYCRIEELGGRRGKSPVPPEINAFWTNQSFHNYADYALSDEFHRGLSQLKQLSRERRCAIMCSEALWWRCHRRLVSDYLIYDGRDVFHLMGSARVDVATMTAAARADGLSLVYPASEIAEQ